MVLARLAPDISEADFLTAVVEVAMLRGWRVYHALPARTSKGWRTPTQGHVGFVDLVMARRGRVIFAELKTAHGRLSAAQQEWFTALGDVYLWRPQDFDEIRRVLR